MSKRTTVDDGSYTVSGGQMKRQFASACSAVFGDEARTKRNRLVASLVASSAGSVSTEGQGAPQKKKDAGEKNKQDDEEEDEMAGVSALARKLGLESSGKKPAAAKASAKSSASGGATPTKGGKQPGSKALNATLQAMEDAKVLLNKVIPLKTLDDFKELEADLKEMAQRLANKADVLINGNKEEYIEAYRVRNDCLVAARNLVKSWKAVVHAGNEKNKTLFIANLRDFHRSYDGQSSKPTDLFAVAGADAVKVLVASCCARCEWEEACQNVGMLSLITEYGFNQDMASSVQTDHVEEIFKRAVRKLHDVPHELAKVWNACIVKLGLIANKTLKVALDHLTCLVNADEEARTKDELEASLEFTKTAKVFDPFVKVIVLVGHRLVNDATKKSEVMRAVVKQAIDADHILGDARPLALFSQHVEPSSVTRGNCEIYVSGAVQVSKCTNTNSQQQRQQHPGA